MSKGLKAIKKLKEYWLNHLPLSVRQGLKIVSTLEKELKALEIIKEKEVDIQAMKDLQDLEDYNYYCSPELT